MTGMPDPRDVLAFYLEAGVDEAIAEAPQNWFARTEPPALRPPPPSQTPPGRPASPSAAPASGQPASGRLVAPRDAASSAREIAAACADLAALREALLGFEGCALKRTASSTVIGDGNPNARVMLIGEAPGAEEDRQGLPFVGPAGRLLDRMLAAIGLDRQTVYITNILPWRPPGNRTPTTDEIAICLPFVQRQIGLIKPTLVIMVGGISAKALLNTAEGITRLRGRWLTLENPWLAVPVAATALFHPAFLLRQSSFKREAWRDLLAIEHHLGAREER